MLRTIAIVLFVLWLVGFVGFGQAVGTFIHLLILAAVVMFLLDLFSGGRARTI